MLLTGFCVHSGTVAPPAIKQAVNFSPPAASHSAWAGSLSPVLNRGSSLFFLLAQVTSCPRAYFFCLSSPAAFRNQVPLFCSFPTSSTSCNTCSFKKPHWLCVHQLRHLFQPPAQVKMHLQTQKGLQVRGDNSSALRHYIVSEEKKNLQLSALDRNKNLGS